jgi:hypothetical protein
MPERPLSFPRCVNCAGFEPAARFGPTIAGAGTNISTRTYRTSADVGPSRKIHFVNPQVYDGVRIELGRFIVRGEKVEYRTFNLSVELHTNGEECLITSSSS